MRIFLTVLFLFISLPVHSQTFPTTYISPSNISWSKEELPIEIVNNKSYREWLKNSSSENLPIRWSVISLTSDKNEVLIQELVGGSGGLGTIVFQKNGNNWIKLTEIFGGFIFYPVPSNKHTLVIYEKSGIQYYRLELEFNGKTYVKKSSYEVPIELTRLNKSPIDFYKYFWFMNGKEVMK
jgi:hypothetical protein